MFKKQEERGERRQTVTMKAFQQTSTSIILSVAKAGISSLVAPQLKCVFDPQSSGPCRRRPRRKTHTHKQELPGPVDRKTTWPPAHRLGIPPAASQTGVAASLRYKLGDG